MDDVRSTLCVGIEQLGLVLNETQVENLLSYITLIKTWNQAYNLVGTSDSHELVHKHILDSLSIAQFITTGPVLDVGSGAGLPGIPLAIVLPDLSFTLLDSNGKKARFMRQASLELKLGNINIVQTRVEQYANQNQPNIVLSRAFAPLEQAINLLKDVCAPNGWIKIMLGIKPEELPESAGVHHMEITPISVPGLNSTRHLLVAQRN